MKTLKRQIQPEDLKEKGYPFACLNCGNKPSPKQVVDAHGECEICGDVITAFTIDTAEFILANAVVRDAATRPDTPGDIRPRSL